MGKCHKARRRSRHARRTRLARENTAKRGIVAVSRRERPRRSADEGHVFNHWFQPTAGAPGKKPSHLLRSGAATSEATKAGKRQPWRRRKGRLTHFISRQIY